MTKEPPPEPPHVGRLGTFGGVFTPSVLTILGVIMFLRFGFVTGTAGLDRTILIVLVANLVSVFTSLSLAVIATNTRVKGGGDYFLISRTLGLEVGGAIGTVLYVAQSVSVGFYVVGFSEALGQAMGGFTAPAAVFGVEVPEVVRSLSPDAWSRIVSTVTCLALFALSYRGADVATRFQFVIMAALLAALVSYFWGAAAHFDASSIAGNRGPAEGGLPFWATFAIFFPAITGFTQGVSMSGELRDPAKSLPRGTFLAVGASLLVYLALPVFLAATTSREHLLTDVGALSLKRSATVGWLVDVGVLAATLSSALASFMGAPRILRAMGRDALFPGARVFAQADQPHGEPTRATSLTLLVAVACIWAGDLNALATVVTMFFLLSYGALNYATFVEGFSRNPSFRPRFKFSGWRTSLVGAFLCAGVMLAIDPLATVVAVTVLSGIRAYLVRRELESPSGDALRGFYTQRIKDYLLKLRRRPPHARDWRPVVLAAHRPEDPEGPLVAFARAVSAEQGVLSVAVLLVGPFEERVAERVVRLKAFDEAAASGDLGYFLDVPVADTFSQAIRAVVQSHGIGRLRPNTLVLYWSEVLEAEYVDVLREATALGVNVVLLRPQHASATFVSTTTMARPPKDRTIDVWWRGRENGSFALLLAHLVREARGWRGVTVRLLRIVREPERTAEYEAELAALVETSRIPAQVVVVVSQDEPFDVIAQHSENRHLVLLGVGGVAGGQRADLARYNALLPRLPTTVLVHAAIPIDVEV